MKVKELRWLKITLTLEYDRGVPADAAEGIRGMFSREEILFEKKTKSGSVVTQNLMEMLKDVTVSQTNENTLCMTCLISAQNPALNPARITEAVEGELPALAPDFTAVRRLEALTEQGQIFH